MAVIDLKKYHRKETLVGGIEITPARVSSYIQTLRIPVNGRLIQYVVTVTEYQDGWIWSAKRVLGKAEEISELGVVPELISSVKEEPQILYTTPDAAIKSATHSLMDLIRY